VSVYSQACQDCFSLFNNYPMPFLHSSLLLAVIMCVFAIASQCSVAMFVNWHHNFCFQFTLFLYFIFLINQPIGWLMRKVSDASDASTNRAQLLQLDKADRCAFHYHCSWCVLPAVHSLISHLHTSISYIPSYLPLIQSRRYGPWKRVNKANMNFYVCQKAVHLREFHYMYMCTRYS